MPYDFFMTRYMQAYINETTSFCNTLIAGTDVTPSGLDGQRALEMAMACDKSLKEGRAVLLSEVQL